MNNKPFRTIIAKFASRKFLSAAVTAATLFATGQVVEGTIVIATYLVGQSAVDVVEAIKKSKDVPTNF